MCHAAHKDAEDDNIVSYYQRAVLGIGIARLAAMLVSTAGMLELEPPTSTGV